MNGKPDEHLDEWVRQSLNKLPNTPPPGTQFDAGRLWTKMRPELQKKPYSRQWGWVWWAAAACLVGAVLGWLRLNQPQRESSSPITHVKRPSPPVAINRELNSLTFDDRLKESSVRPNYSSRPASKQMEKQIGPVSAPVFSSETTEPSVSYKNEPQMGVHADSVRSFEPKKTKETIASAPKRRFQVVHLNELQAEEEIRPTTYRTEGFVRLGLGNTETHMPETAHPSITLPITNKSIQ